MTRAQLTRMIRVESEITALIGAVVGIVVGLGLAALTTKALGLGACSASPGSRCSCSRPPPSSPGSPRASSRPPRRPPTRARWRPSTTSVRPAADSAEVLGRNDPFQSAFGPRFSWTSAIAASGPYPRYRSGRAPSATRDDSGRPRNGSSTVRPSPRCSSTQRASDSRRSGSGRPAKPSSGSGAVRPGPWRSYSCRA